MGRNWIVTASIVLGLMLFGYIIGDINFVETMSLLENAQWSYVFGYLAASFLLMLSFVMMWRIVLRSQNIEIPFINAFNYRVADYTISFLTPGPKHGGEFTRSALVEKHGVDFGDAFSNTMLDKSVEVFCASIFYAIGVVLVTLFVPLPIYWEIFAYVMSVVFSLIVIGFYECIVRGKSLFHGIFRILMMHKIPGVKKTESGVEEFEKKLRNFFLEDKKRFFIASFFSLSRWVIAFAEFKFIMLMLGLDSTWAQLFVIFTFISLGNLFPVPMGLGTTEASQITAMTLLGISPQAGVMVALINRVRDLLWSGMGMLILIYYGMDVKKIFLGAWNMTFAMKDKMKKALKIR